MSIHRFHEGPLPEGYVFGFEPAVFNTPDYLMSVAANGWRSFYTLSDKSRKVIAAIHFHVRGELAHSHPRAPFGSVECDAEIKPDVLFQFLEFVEQRLKSMAIREMMIKNPPRAYGPEFLALLETFLFNREFSITSAEPGAVIEVSDREFTAGIAHAQELRIKQAKASGLAFQMLPIEHLDDVFSFISSCYRERGYDISVTADALRETARRIPCYLLSSVTVGGAIVAAAISVRVKSTIVYNFMVGHEPGMSSLSPPVLLMEGLYNHCRANRISLLDLGTSALDGNPNFSLFDFKLRMGARPTSKLTFHKQIDR